eukprot:16524-Chlamydomonas_euryale.AAC.2
MSDARGVDGWGGVVEGAKGRPSRRHLNCADGVGEGAGPGMRGQALSAWAVGRGTIEGGRKLGAFGWCGRCD